MANIYEDGEIIIEGLIREINACYYEGKPEGINHYKERFSNWLNILYDNTDGLLYNDLFYIFENEILPLIPKLISLEHGKERVDVFETIKAKLEDILFTLECLEDESLLDYEC